VIVLCRETGGGGLLCLLCDIASRFRECVDEKGDAARRLRISVKLSKGEAKNSSANCIGSF
jgi:hypothetical protein